MRSKKKMIRMKMYETTIIVEDTVLIMYESLCKADES